MYYNIIWYNMILCVYIYIYTWYIYIYMLHNVLWCNGNNNDNNDNTIRQGEFCEVHSGVHKGIAWYWNRELQLDTGLPNTRTGAQPNTRQALVFCCRTLPNREFTNGGLAKGGLAICVFPLCNYNTLGYVFNVQIEIMPNW